MINIDITKANDYSFKDIQAMCREIRLSPMATCFIDLMQNNEKVKNNEMTYREFFLRLILEVQNSRANSRLEKKLKLSDFTFKNALYQDLDFSKRKGFSKRMADELYACDWINAKKNLIIESCCGGGKTWLADCYGLVALMKGFKVKQVNAGVFINELASIPLQDAMSEIQELAKLDVLIIDDFGLNVARPNESFLFLELAKALNSTTSIVITTSKKKDGWYNGYFSESDVAVTEAFCDRFTGSNTITITLDGDSYR